MSDNSIKVLAFLDELEELINNSSKMPFTEKGILDRDTALQIIEDIRQQMPEDIKEAQWIRQEKNRIITETKEEYSKIIAQAKERAEYLVDSNLIKKEAERRATEILEEAENHANFIKLKTYEYVDQLLYDMQNSVANAASTYIMPMSNYFNEMLNTLNLQVNKNRQEMKNLAAGVQLGTPGDKE